VSVVHQIGQEEGPPTFGGSCTYDLEGLMNGQMVVGFGNTLNKSKCKLDLSHQVKMSGEKSPPLSSTLKNVENFMVLTTAFETTTAIEGDGFEGVGIMDNPMCCVAKLVAVKRNETSKILEENDIYKSSINSGGARKYGRNNSVMDTVVDGPLLLGNKTHKVVNDAGDGVFNYCCSKPLH